MSRARGTIATPLALLLLLLVLVGAAMLGRNRAQSLPDLSRWETAIDAHALEYKLDANLLRGLIAAESGGNPEAKSKAGAVGLVQLMPATAREEAERMGMGDYAEERLTEPLLNLRLGAAYLGRLLKRYDGEEAFALAAYNAGPARVRRWRERAPDLSPREVILREGFKETRTHMERVFHFRHAYRLRYPRGRP